MEDIKNLKFFARNGVLVRVQLKAQGKLNENI